MSTAPTLVVELEVVPMSAAMTALDMSRDTIDRYVQRGKLKRVKIGGKSYIVRATLDDMIREAMGTTK